MTTLLCSSRLHEIRVSPYQGLAACGPCGTRSWVDDLAAPDPALCCCGHLARLHGPRHGLTWACPLTTCTCNAKPKETTVPESTGPDWNDLGLRLSALTARIKVAEPQTPPAKVFAQALEQLVTETRELVTGRYHSAQIAAHKGISAHNEADLRRQTDRARAERHITVTQFRTQLTEQLRGRVNPWSFPSRYRREGATTVVDWIDPDNPATPPPIARYSQA